MKNEPVILAGAGPGGLAFMTEAVRNAVENADIIFYDRLIHPEIKSYLQTLPAQCIDIGKSPDGPSATQTGINEQIASAAENGYRVVRLKGGDPCVFGRGGEERKYLEQRGIPTVFLPGITSGIAVPESVGIPVTYRGTAPSVTLVTGHSGTGEEPDWSWYAKCPGTLVIYMGAKTIAKIANALISEGMNPDTETAVIEHGFQEDCRVTCCSLQELAADTRRFLHPAITVIGKVAGMYRSS